MNFDDTPQEAAFRAEAKAWIAANAPKQYEEDLRKSSLGRTQIKGANILEVAKACRRSPQEKRSGASCFPNPPGDRMSRACARARSEKATTGSSTARRSGPRARIIPTTASC